MQNVDTSKTAFCKKQRSKSNHIFSKITFYQRYVTIIWIEMIHKTDKEEKVLWYLLSQCKNYKIVLNQHLFTSK